MDANTHTEGAVVEQLSPEEIRAVEQQKAEEDAKALYVAILEVAREFLHNSKHFSVEVLAEENPTYEAVAELMSNTARMIWALADDFDPLISQKAYDYCELMTKMGIAISNKDQLELSKLAATLDKRFFI